MKTLKLDQVINGYRLAAVPNDRSAYIVGVSVDDITADPVVWFDAADIGPDAGEECVAVGYCKGLTLYRSDCNDVDWSLLFCPESCRVVHIFTEDYGSENWIAELLEALAQ